MQTALRLLAPYPAVLIGWILLENAWLTVLAYHALMLLLSPPALGSPAASSIARGHWRRYGWMVGLSILAGPALVLLLPVAAHADLGPWLARFGLSGAAWVVMVPTFGIVHPLLEQRYWAPLRRRTPVAHAMFAGYHLLVLYTLLTPLWLGACFAVLLGASMMWNHIANRAGGLLVPAASHVAADLGLALAAWAAVS